MTILTLVVDERELRTIRAALLLLQEQVDMLPEDVADMICGHGPLVTEAEIERLSRNLGVQKALVGDTLDGEASRIETLTRSGPGYTAINSGR